MPQALFVLARALLLAILGFACACSGSQPPAAGSSWQSSDTGVKDATSGTQAEKYFPMKDGTLYHYETESIGAGPVKKGMLMMRVHRVSASKAELRKPAGTQVFEFTSAGIATTTKSGQPAFLLKTPFDPQSVWLGPQGGNAHVEATNQSFGSAAGHFTGCLRVVEEQGGDAPWRIQTLLCPDVGIVSLEIQSGDSGERAELVYYGPPVDVGPDGLKRVQ